VEQHAAILSRNTEIDNLKLLVLKLKRMHFGHHSEKLNRAIEQLELRLEDLEAAAAPALTAAPVDAPAAETAQKKPARRPLPESLPRTTETHAPKHTTCPDCGGKLRALGEDVAEVLEYVPGHFEAIRLVRPKLSCTACERIVQEPAPSRPIDRGLAGPGLLAHVIDRSIPTIFRSIDNRKSTRGKESIWTARHWPVGWAVSRARWNRWWKRYGAT
jgi:hypothetical protein